MYYKNTSHSQMKFYGVVFKPGDVKEVPGYINHPKFVMVPEPKVEVKVEKPQSKPKETKIDQTEGGK